MDTPGVNKFLTGSEGFKVGFEYLHVAPDMEVLDAITGFDRQCISYCTTD